MSGDNFGTEKFGQTPVASATIFLSDDKDAYKKCKAKCDSWSKCKSFSLVKDSNCQTCVENIFDTNLRTSDGYADLNGAFMNKPKLFRVKEARYGQKRYCY